MDVTRDVAMPVHILLDIGVLLMDLSKLVFVNSFFVFLHAYMDEFEVGHMLTLPVQVMKDLVGRPIDFRKSLIYDLKKHRSSRQICLPSTICKQRPKLV